MSWHGNVFSNPGPNMLTSGSGHYDFPKISSLVSFETMRQATPMQTRTGNEEKSASVSGDSYFLVITTHETNTDWRI